MLLFALMHLLQQTTCLPVAVPTKVWVSEQELLKNSTMTDPNIPACLITPAILDPNFRHENHPTAKLRGSLHNAHGGSDAFVLISPVPCERSLLFTFSAYTTAKNQTLMLMASAKSDKGKILRFYSEGAHNPFGQIVALSAGQWVKINKTYIMPKGTQSLEIFVNNSNPQDVHIADAHLVVRESGGKQEQVTQREHPTSWRKLARRRAHKAYEEAALTLQMQRADRPKTGAGAVAQLEADGVIGAWADRQDIGDSAKYARELRRQAETRERG